MSRPGRRYAKFKEMLIDVSLRGGRQSRVGSPVLSAAWPWVIHPSSAPFGEPRAAGLTAGMSPVPVSPPGTWGR